MKKAVILFFILLFPSLFYIFLSSGKHNIMQLPIYGPRKAVAEGDTMYHKVLDFEFTNQFGEQVTQEHIKDKFFVVDFFFATCKGICPKMSYQLSRVQEKTKGMDDFIIISHTVNPEHDTVEVLLDYASKMGATKDRWHFVTGEKKHLYDIARNAYFITAMEGDGGPEDFIHSEKLVLVDKERRIRGYYDGTNKEEVDKLIDEISVLKAWELAPKKKQS